MPHLWDRPTEMIPKRIRAHPWLTYLSQSAMILTSTQCIEHQAAVKVSEWANEFANDTVGFRPFSQLSCSVFVVVVERSGSSFSFFNYIVPKAAASCQKPLPKPF